MVARLAAIVFLFVPFSRLRTLKIGHRGQDREYDANRADSLQPLENSGSILIGAIVFLDLAQSPADRHRSGDAAFDCFALCRLAGRRRGGRARSQSGCESDDD